MKLCVITSKECWQDENGRWLTSGGFPLQMAAIGSLFDSITLVVLMRKPQAGGTPLPAAARVVPLRKPRSGNFLRKFSVVFQLPYYLRLIRQEVSQADVVHTPVPGDIGLLGMWVALSMKKRLIVRYGSSWPRTPQMTLMNGVTKFFTRRFAGGRNVMLATGAGQDVPEPRMHWIFTTAISRSEMAAVQPVFERGLSNPPRLAALGRLAPEKSLDTLIRAVAQLKQEGFSPLPVVELIGEGPLRASLEQLAQETGCRDQIIFQGQMSRPAMLEHLNTIDICVMPSLTESFGKARIDAMLCGLPVITTEVGFGRELVGQDGQRGWIIPIGDSQTLANTLRQILTSPIDWPALRRRCRAAVEGYTLEAWAEEIGTICARQWNVSLEKGKLNA